MVRADGAQSQLLGGGYRPSGGADAVLVYRAKKKPRTYQHWRPDEDHRENDDLTTDREATPTTKAGERRRGLPQQRWVVRRADTGAVGPVRA